MIANCDCKLPPKRARAFRTQLAATTLQWDANNYPNEERAGWFCSRRRRFLKSRFASWGRCSWGLHKTAQNVDFRINTETQKKTVDFQKKRPMKKGDRPRHIPGNQPCLGPSIETRIFVFVFVLIAKYADQCCICLVCVLFFYFLRFVFVLVVLVFLCLIFECFVVGVFLCWFVVFVFCLGFLLTYFVCCVVFLVLFGFLLFAKCSRSFLGFVNCLLDSLLHFSNLPSPA